MKVLDFFDPNGYVASNVALVAKGLLVSLRV